MKKILLFLIGVLIVILEGSIVNYINLFGVSINLVLIYITIITLYLENVESITIAILLGFIRDISIGSIFGVNALILAIVAYGISNLNDKIYKNSYTTILVLVFISSLIDSVINIIISAMIYQPYGILYTILKGIFIAPVVNSIGSLVLYYIFNRSILKLKKD